MGGDRAFWLLFGGVFLAVGVMFMFAAAGVNLFANPDQLDGAPPWVFALAGLAGCSFGSVIIWRTLRARAREQRLLQIGVPVSATVTDVRRSRIEINRQPRWYVCYRYEYGGRTLTGESDPMVGELAADYTPGDTAQIKVDPSRPEDSLFIGTA